MDNRPDTIQVDGKDYISLSRLADDYTKRFLEPTDSRFRLEHVKNYNLFRKWGTSGKNPKLACLNVDGENYFPCEVAEHLMNIEKNKWAYKRAGVSKQTLLAWLDKGLVDYVQPDGFYRYILSHSLDEYLAERRREDKDPKQDQALQLLKSDNPIRVKIIRGDARIFFDDVLIHTMDYVKYLLVFDKFSYSTHHEKYYDYQLKLYPIVVIGMLRQYGYIEKDLFCWVPANVKKDSNSIST